MRFQLTSPAFNHSTQIPVKYSCDGQDISPPLAWRDIPEGTQSLALVMDDPDAPAGTWVHWILFNLPPDLGELPEQTSLPDNAQVGKNNWGRTDYGGPCPPSGTHRYFFKLYALDTTLNLDSPPDKTQLLQAMEGHILAQAELMGTYTSQ